MSIKCYHWRGGQRCGFGVEKELVDRDGVILVLELVEHFLVEGYAVK
jgi:hypothetical protein